VIAFVFPGQNSHYVGMGRDLHAAGGPAVAVFETAQSVLEPELLTVMFEGPAAALRRTQIQQPAIVTHSLAALAALRESGIAPDFVAGHSVGEYSAVACAGCVGAAEALRLVRFRAELMAAAGDSRPGAMAAILGLGRAAVEELVEQAGDADVVVVANYNSPGQIVISGAVDAVERASALAGEAGAKRVIRLDVSGGFHSPLMEPAARPLIERLERADFATASVPVVSNVDAQPRTDPGEIRDALGRQMTSGVMWRQSVERMVSEGVQVFVEIGPGTVLSRLIRRIDPDVSVLNVEDTESLEQAVAELG